MIIQTLSDCFLAGYIPDQLMQNNEVYGMRSRLTNTLQIIVLFDGLVFVVIGVAFYISPMDVIMVFSKAVSDNWNKEIYDSWLELITVHDLVVPLYYFTKGCAALMVTSGISMVLPLFDPLKYRGLIYYNGVIFPLMAAVLFLKNGIPYFLLRNLSQEEAAKLSSSPGGLLLLFVLGIAFAVVFIVSCAGLIITAHQTREGKE